MPKYNGVFVEGACERLSHPCINKKYFTGLAEEFKAIPVVRFETVEWDDIKDEPITIKRNCLEVPEELVEQVTYHLGVDEFWMHEFPCHVDCPITICGLCGKQHEVELIHGNWCELEEYDEEEELGYL